jgi:hypothetical protein
MFHIKYMVLLLKCINGEKLNSDMIEYNYFIIIYKMSLVDIIYGFMAIAIVDLFMKFLQCINKYREETKKNLDNLNLNIKTNEKELLNISHNTNTIASNLPNYSKDSLKLIIMAQFGELINYYTTSNKIVKNNRWQFEMFDEKFSKLLSTIYNDSYSYVVKEEASIEQYDGYYDDLKKFYYFSKNMDIYL